MARDIGTEGMRAVLSQFALQARLTLGADSLEPICRDTLDSAGRSLSKTLSRWAAETRHAVDAATCEVSYGFREQSTKQMPSPSMTSATDAARWLEGCAATRRRPRAGRGEPLTRNRSHR